jgi:hypothetical protein
MTDKRVYTHTWPGLLWYDIPLALILTFLFHNLVRNPIIDNAPINFQRRLKHFEYFKWTLYFKKRWLAIIGCIIIGIISHLLWDGFTHENGYFVKYLPFLTFAIPVGSFHLEVHMILQVISSILGGLIILYSLWQLPIDEKAPISPDYLPFWKQVTLLAVFIFIIRLLFGISHEIEDFIIPAISAFLIALVIQSALVKRRRHQ